MQRISTPNIDMKIDDPSLAPTIPSTMQIIPATVYICLSFLYREEETLTVNTHHQPFIQGQHHLFIERAYTHITMHQFRQTTTFFHILSIKLQHFLQLFYKV